MLIKPQKLPFWPIVVIPSEKVPRHCWLAWRRSGIGGSDVAKILGVCPFGTARDLFYDKKGIVDANDAEANKWQKHIGHVLENTVAEMFSEVTGYPVFKVAYMFRSPEHPFMLADVDYFCVLPDGSIAILEIKTTSPDAIGKWWDGGRAVIPLNYQLQGRHYMSVMKLNKVFFACLYGNSPQHLLIREMNRDLDIEAEIIFLESEFWHGSVLADVPPPYLEDGALCEESVRRHHGPADPDAPHIILPEDVGRLVPRYIAMQREKNEYVRRMESELKRMKAIIADHMGKTCTASCNISGQEYVVSFNPSVKAKIAKSELVLLQNRMPKVYDEYVSYTEERRFYAKAVSNAAA